MCRCQDAECQRLTIEELERQTRQRDARKRDQELELWRHDIQLADEYLRAFFALDDTHDTVSFVLAEKADNYYNLAMCHMVAHLFYRDQLCL